MISLDEKKTIIQNTEIFKDIPTQYLEAVAKRMGEEQVSAGSYLFKEGDSGNRMMVIHEGEVEIIKGKNTTLAVIRQGDVLGEMAALSGEKRSTSARAKGNVTILFLKAEALRLLMHKIPNLSHDLMRLLIRRLKNANAIIQNLGQKSENAGGHQLRIDSGEQSGQSIEIPEVLIIGRGNPKKRVPGRLNLYDGENSQISRRHAEIFQRQGNYFIRDLGSRNGVKVNDIRLAEIISLLAGDKVQIGEVLLSFEKV